VQIHQYNFLKNSTTLFKKSAPAIYYIYTVWSMFGVGKKCFFF